MYLYTPSVMIDVKFAQISLRFEIYFVGATKLIVELAYFY
jgi:hypothetical protein